MMNPEFSGLAGPSASDVLLSATAKGSTQAASLDIPEYGVKEIWKNICLF